MLPLLAVFVNHAAMRFATDHAAFRRYESPLIGLEAIQIQLIIHHLRYACSHSSAPICVTSPT